MLPTIREKRQRIETVRLARNGFSEHRLGTLVFAGVEQQRAQIREDQRVVRRQCKCPMDQQAIVPPLLVVRGRPGGIVSRGVRLWRHFSDLGNAVWLRTESGL